MSIQYLKLSQHFLKEEPQSAALRIETMTAEQGAFLLAKVPLKIAANVLSVMDSRYAYSLLQALKNERVIEILASMELADVAAIIRFGQADHQQELLSAMPIRRQNMCKLLISYPRNTIGSLVKTDLLLVDEKMKVSEALFRIKKHAASDSQFVYVVNRKKQLVGTITVLALFGKPKDIQLSTILLEIPTILNGAIDLETAVSLDCWRTTDFACISNRQSEFIGILRHVSLRRAQSKDRSNRFDDGSVLGEVVFGYAETVHTALSAVFGSK